MNVGREGKRKRWIELNKAILPLSSNYELQYYCAPEALDTSSCIPKRQFDRLSREWLERRRRAFAAYAYFAGYIIE